jgi:surface antigen
MIYVDETICIPGNKSGNGGNGGGGNPPGHQPVRGGGDPYPYGQCTWWASQRYYELHGVYVPWASQSDAWEWTARAHDFYWTVSSKPSYGAIVDLQPWVQGAYGLGHVAVVEKILPNGDVIASNMNWGGSSQVVDVEFTPGSGVTFITF